MAMVESERDGGSGRKSLEEERWNAWWMNVSEG